MSRCVSTLMWEWDGGVLATPKEFQLIDGCDQRLVTVRAVTEDALQGLRDVLQGAGALARRAPKPIPVRRFEGFLASNVTA